MTSTDHRPPLRAVNPRQPDDRAAWQLDRRRFAAFLTAKDLVLGYTRTATEGAGRLAARLHLDGVFTMVHRSYGWLLGAASVAARGLRAPGVLAGLVWGLSTDCGADPGRQGRSGSQHSRQHGRRCGGEGGRLDHAAVRHARGTAGHLARQPGDRGQAGSHRPGPAAAAPRWAAAVAEPASQGGGRDRPGTSATGSGRSLPAPPEVLAGPGRREHRAAPTTPPTPMFTVEVGEPTRDSDLLERASGLEPSQLRYPAPKRSMAKKRR